MFHCLSVLTVLCSDLNNININAILSVIIVPNIFTAAHGQMHSTLYRAFVLSHRSVVTLKDFF